MILFAAIALAVVVIGVSWKQHTQSVANGDSWRYNQEGVCKAGVFGVSQLIKRICQVIIIAMTTVLPLPVAIFNAMRKSSGFATSLLRLSSLWMYVSP